VLMVTVLDDPDAVERAFAGRDRLHHQPIHWAVLRHRVSSAPTIPALQTVRGSKSRVGAASQLSGWL